MSSFSACDGMRIALGSETGPPGHCRPSTAERRTDRSGNLPVARDSTRSRRPARAFGASRACEMRHDHAFNPFVCDAGGGSGTGVHRQGQGRQDRRAPTDPQIAAIVVAANSVDIDAGKFASGKTHNDDVKKFADLMVTDHTAVNKSAGDLCAELGVTPEEDATSKSLRAGGVANVKKLKKLSGEKFDKAYVDHEVDYHVAVLKEIDDVLIPNAQNADLKALIVKVRPAIAAHLEHAQNLQKALASK